MGSRGTGAFTNNTGQPASGVGGNGGQSGSDKCIIDKDVPLEDVARCAYFSRNNTVPPPGTKVNLVFNSIRLEVVDLSGLTIGYLPMTLHYLVQCMNDGHNYSVGIIQSRNMPLPHVLVNVKHV